MKRGHDLSGLMKFATSPAWADHLGEALADHLEPAIDEFDFGYEDLADIVGDHWAGVLWGCAFEDLLTRDLEPDGRNIVDEYIKRRGWNESGPAKTYMRALRSSVTSLYEVSEIEPGQGFFVRDLIRGGEPVRVSERSASQTLKQWDRIGARVVEVGGKHLLSGGLLSFPMETADDLVRGLRRAEGKRSPRTTTRSCARFPPSSAPHGCSTSCPVPSSRRVSPCCTIATARRWCSTASASPFRGAPPTP